MRWFEKKTCCLKASPGRARTASERDGDYYRGDTNGYVSMHYVRTAHV
jgi:hypothetical protein